MTQQQKIMTIDCGKSREHSILPVQSILDTGICWSFYDLEFLDESIDVVKEGLKCHQ